MLAASESVTEMQIKFGFCLPCPTVGFWSSRELFLSQMWVTTCKVLFLSISPLSHFLSHNKFNEAWFAFLKGQLRELVCLLCTISVFFSASSSDASYFKDMDGNVLTGSGDLYCDVKRGAFERWSEKWLTTVKCWHGADYYTDGL